MATVVITDEAELQAFLASGKKGDAPTVADPGLGTVAWSEEKGRWVRLHVGGTVIPGGEIPSQLIAESNRELVKTRQNTRPEAGQPTSGCAPVTGGDPVGLRLFARYAGQAASRASALDEVTGVTAETYERVVRGLPLEPDPGTGFRDDPARHRSDAADAMAYAITAHRAPDPRTGFRDDPARPGVRYLDVTRPGDLERRLWWERDLDTRCTAFHLRSVTCQGRCAERAYRVADMEAERSVDFRFLAERVLREFGGELTADAVGRMLADAYPDRGSSLLEGMWKAYALGYDRGRAEAAGEARLEERRSIADGLELWARHARGDTGSAAAVRMLASILRDHDDRRDGPLERRFEQRARYGHPADFPLARRGETVEGLWKPGDPGRKADRSDDGPAKR